MHFFRVLLSIFVLLPNGVIAEISAQVTDFKLKNGMEVVVIEDHRAPVVVHMVWYKAGSGEEDPGVSGVAHFLEHLLFKQTKTMDAGEFSRVVAENGGSDNAFTSYDYTGYFQNMVNAYQNYFKELLCLMSIITDISIYTIKWHTNKSFCRKP